MTNRIVITGIGVVAPNGVGKEAYWKGLTEGTNSIGRVTRFVVDTFASHVGAEVTDFHPHPKIPADHLKHMDRAYQFAVSSAWQAVEDAGIDFNFEDASRVGVYMGVAVAAVDACEPQFHALRDHGILGLNSYMYQTWFPSACSGYISLAFGLHGQSHVFSTGCTSSADAMGAALQSLRDGDEDIAIVGGAEAPLTPIPYNAFCAMRALSTRNQDPTHASRPFDRERDGFILGEGGAVLILETEQHARERGATIYAELAGYATTSNAFHMTAPEPTGEQSARAFRLCLQDAHLTPADIGYICAHGSSTPLNEKIETMAIKNAFGKTAYSIPISSIKSMIGHALGAAGALQVAACALALERGVIPPTINYEFPDPLCDLDYVPNEAREKPLQVAITNNAGFSGKNSVLALRQFKGR